MLIKNIADIVNILIFCRGVQQFRAAVTPNVSELILSLNGGIDSSLTDVNHANTVVLQDNFSSVFPIRFHTNRALQSLMLVSGLKPPDNKSGVSLRIRSRENKYNNQSIVTNLCLFVLVYKTRLHITWLLMVHMLFMLLRLHIRSDY